MNAENPPYTVAYDEERQRGVLFILEKDGKKILAMGKAMQVGYIKTVSAEDLLSFESNEEGAFSASDLNPEISKPLTFTVDVEKSEMDKFIRQLSSTLNMSYESLLALMQQVSQSYSLDFNSISEHFYQLSAETLMLSAKLDEIADFLVSSSNGNDHHSDYAKYQNAKYNNLFHTYGNRRNNKNKRVHRLRNSCIKRRIPGLNNQNYEQRT